MDTPTQKWLYVLGDGDRIRERIEYHLLREDLDALTKLSQALTAGIEHVGAHAVATMRAEVIVAGGDDIFFRVDHAFYKTRYLEDLANLFTTMTGATISFGVGLTIANAYLNLRRAKVTTTCKIVVEEGAEL